MPSAKKTSYFRMNPVEVVIFSIITMVFADSAYDLFYNHDEFKPQVLTPARTESTSDNRNPASASNLNPSLQTVVMDCGKTADQAISAGKVRLNGTLCGLDQNSAENRNRVEAAVSNLANQFNATVFSDVHTGKFSTDYIPLNSGKNTILIRFSYGNGTTISQEIIIHKVES